MTSERQRDRQREAIGPGVAPAAGIAAVASLDALLAEIRACRACLDHPVGPPLPHQPRPVVQASVTARLGISGQAPGTRVHASGLPFDDRSGDRLRDWIGIDRDAFYDASRIAIVPMGFCFPGQDAAGADLPPRPECAPLWRGRLLAALPRLELLLLVGSWAQRWHLGVPGPGGMTGTVAAWRRVLAEPHRPRLLPMPHPSWRNTGWLKRNPWFEAELVPALRAEVERLLRR